MPITRQWEDADGAALLAGAPGAWPDFARIEAVMACYLDDLRTAHARLAEANALLEQARGMRCPLLPPCDDAQAQGGSGAESKKG